MGSPEADPKFGYRDLLRKFFQEKLIGKMGANLSGAFQGYLRLI